MSDSIDALPAKIETSIAIPENAEDIHRLIHEGWRTFVNEEKGPTAQEVEDLFQTVLTPQSLAKTIATGRQKYLVAKRDGKIVGVISWLERPDRIAPGNFHSQDPRAALSLMRAAQEQMDPTKDWIASVVQHNEHAIRLYERLGFVRSSKEPWVEELPIPGKKGRRPMIEMIKKAEV